MTDIPIIFSAPMVRALIREAKHPGTGKTMTRRLPTPQWRRAKPGDRLWVRESILQSLSGMTYPSGEYVSHWSEELAEYLADDPMPQKRFLRPDTYNSPWMQSRPSIHMPRIFSRLTLTVTATKIEHLQDISERDAIREGIYTKKIEIDGLSATGYFGANDEAGSFSAKREFECLWCGLHGVENWSADPQVIALTFTVHQQNIDALKVAA